MALITGSTPLRKQRRRRRGPAGFGVLGAIGRGDGGRLLAAQAPPEITTIRIDFWTVRLSCAAIRWPRSCCTRRALPRFTTTRVDTGGSPTKS